MHRHHNSVGTPPSPLGARGATRLGAIAAAGILLLAGCTPIVVTPGGESTPAPTVTVTAAPTTERGPDYGFTFFREGQIGATFSELSDQLHYPVGGIEECPWYGTVWNTELATTYAFTDSSNPDSGVQFFYSSRFLASDDASFPRNAEGVGLGNTEAEIMAAHPDAVAGSVDDDGAGTVQTLTVDDPASDSIYVFGFSGGSAVVDLLQWGPRAGNQWSHLCIGL